MRFLKPLLASVVLFGGQLLAEDKAPAAASEPTKPAIASAPAVEAPLALKYDELVLADGKKLKKVVIKSYDAKSEKLLMVANGKAMMLPVAQVAEPLRTALKEGAPKAGETLSSAPVAPPAPVRIVPHPFENLQNMGPAAPVARVAPTEVSLEAHKSAALSRAQNYYRYEYPIGSDAARVTSTNFEVEDPEVVSGWAGRYRTRGKVFLEFFDSKGWSYRRTASTFEVLTEQGKGSTPKVIDFSVKS